MDSLLANYASDDDEEDQQEEEHQPPPPHRQNPNPPHKSLLFSLPPPKSSSSSKFRSLPPPVPSSSLFASLHHPKPDPPSSLFAPKPPKKVVQFRPPIDPSVFDDDDDDDDYDSDKKKQKQKQKEKNPEKDPRQRTISSILPPPQHSLSSAPPGRRIALEPEAQGGARSEAGKTEVADTGSVGSDKDGGGGGGSGEEFAEYYGGWGTADGQWGAEASGWAQGDGSYYGNYGDYGGHRDYGVNGAGTEAVVAAAPPPGEMDVGRMVGKKRGRNEIPTEILEVKQEELVKNRPREDQLKATGIALGPAYQPVSSAKGKPTKLHKRKHQIGSLYYDMKQKEQELMERRSRGMLTKRETQGKYGW